MLLATSDQQSDIAISRETLADRAADMLRQLILLEELKPEEILPERQLSARLGVSRTPLREALRMLASEGLVEMTPNMRPRVANPSLQQILDLIDVISSMERLACERMAEKRTPSIIKQLEDDVDKMLNFPDDGEELAFFNLDMDFHKTIVAGTENQSLINTHRQYNAAIYRARFMSTQWVARRPMMHKDHSQILQLIKKGKGIEAGEEMRAHLLQLQTNVTELFKARDAKDKSN